MEGGENHRACPVWGRDNSRTGVSGATRGSEGAGLEAGVAGQGGAAAPGREKSDGLVWQPHCNMYLKALKIAAAVNPRCPWGRSLLGPRVGGAGPGVAAAPGFCSGCPRGASPGPLAAQLRIWGARKQSPGRRLSRLPGKRSPGRQEGRWRRREPSSPGVLGVLRPKHTFLDSPAQQCLPDLPPARASG